ncbi:MAG: acyltransferase domain-containing protein, partial [Chloroflexota bacterium]|jgi:non-ribosomal peptide synthase protein (TIGR01720 family)
VSFLFPGTAAQYVGMGAGLYRTEPVFAEAMEACASIIGDVDGHDLIDLLYGDYADPEAATAVLTRTSVGQPAIFTLQWALSRLWASWGIEPAAMVGHSVGELAAACVGGLFPLEDALRLTAVRGRLMQDLPVGAMTAVSAEESAILPLLDEAVSLAAVNAPKQCVAAGPPGAIDELEHRLTAAEIAFRRLPIGVAAHSPMMEPVLDPLRLQVEGTTRDELRIPMVSTLTGAWTTTAEIGDPEYWVRHTRRTVRFADAVGVLLADRPEMALLEIGPGETLTSLVRQHPASSPANAPISSLPGRAARTDDRIHAYRALADAWAAGTDVDWDAVTGGARRRIPLPTYPFGRQRYWVEAKAPVAQASPGGLGTADVVPAPASWPATMPGADDGESAPGSGPGEGVAAQLTAMLAELSGLDESALDPAVTFTDLGFDSLFLAQFNSQSRRRFGVRIALDHLLTDTSTIDSLATYIEAELDEGRAQAAEPGPPGGDVDGAGDITAPGAKPSPDQPIPIPLLPNVARYMVERETPHPEHWNVSALLTSSRRLDPETTGRVVATLIERHDALRLRISGNGADYRSTIAPATDPLPFAVSDLSGLDPKAQSGAVERRADELQASLDLVHGPLMRVELFELGEQGQRLLVIVHHFVFDQLSWRPFWEDFIALYEDLEGGGGASLPPPVTSYETWARALKRRADSDALRGEIRTWTDLPWDRVQPVPLDHPHGANTNESAEHVELLISREETTALLRGTPGVVRKTDLMLTALACATASWTGSDTVLIDLMGHGRDEAIAEGADPMASVGFFISYTPLVLRLAEGEPDSLSSPLTDQIEPLLRRGLDFDLRRYMASDAGVRQAFHDLPRAQILFNYHGKLDAPEEVPRGSMFSAAPESSGRTHNPSGLRYYPLAVETKVSYGRLRLAFVYSANLHERSTIAALADEFHDQLTNLVADASVA